jgi:amidophosphoribosyltransferase
MADHGDTPFDGDKLHEECGVFGIYGRQDAAAIVTLGLHALQHRGQEAAGIVSFDGKQFHVERHIGQIGDTFTKQSVLDRLNGSRAIGHTRYSTTGGSGLRNVQPFFAELSDGGFAVAHNGNITNAMTIQRELQKRGAILTSTSDTETILHLVAFSKQKSFVDRFVDALSQIEGAFSLVALSSKKLIGCRDPLGIRPLVIGDLEGSLILASETCALDIIGARFVRDVEPGEIVVISESGMESIFPFGKTKPRFCIFNMSISRGPILRSKAGMSTASAGKSARNWPRKIPSRPMLSCLCRIPGRQQPSALQTARGSPSNWALSATTMWDGPSFSRPIRSGTWA